MNHFMNVCRDHGSILGQCRCPSPSKTKNLVDCPGSETCLRIPAAIYPEEFRKLTGHDPRAI